MLGHVYSHLYGMRFIGLRYFTVYGPRQRPDLAIHKFARLMLAGRPIPVYGDGTTSRDYTYVRDTVTATRAAMDYEATPYEIINLGNDRTVSLDGMISAVETALDQRARRTSLPAQPGDVPHTWADITRARELLGYEPSMSFEAGVRLFAEWLQEEA